MNLKHLFYFWKVAKLGSIARAAEAINVTPQTLSGQISLLQKNLGTKLFARKGRSIVLTEAGAMAMEYADEMFALSDEMEMMLKHQPKGRPQKFCVGVSDAIPKSLAFKLLQPAVVGNEGVRIVCREWRIDRLLSELCVHRLDLVISDCPIPSSFNVRAYNHQLLESDLTFLAPEAIMAKNSLPFPACLATIPLLLPGEDAGFRNDLQIWFERQRIHPRVVGEFDDNAMMVAFAKAGMGAFPVPTIVADEYIGTGGLTIIGRIDQVKINYFAISVERRLKHPCVVAITQSAKNFSSDLGE